ncbi:Uncharacterised protein (plasmid) [Tsukamurella tyrosinosolvens]|uniref:Uncharacterized protein n=1 Tax=Tsukamurella tyrosinosolvens TaxID=57704 RepID=A0A1H4VKV0_TSUTY|nr:hypothetical protein [Tsukamurella tyrosinosolvens]KXO90949.1 hypothetical protein AXK58_21180 [Tsukamurella tyrosinosolvens]SEC81636.1 hypothetical protein SAMN04489793_3261 [Tsukamurella tyrosinosolvens]VEH90451.1 Uncharacterised protein [Tsukamurella tyrosinosolvens]
MQETYDLIGGLGAAKEVLTQPAGAIGLISYDGDVRTVFLRGWTVDDPDAYLADEPIYATVEEMVEDSSVTLDREQGEVLAWQITADKYTPLWHYDASRVEVAGSDGDDSDEQAVVERGNNQAICAAIDALPPGAGFLVGGFSPDSDFILGFRKDGVLLSSTCGSSLRAEMLSPAEDLSDIPGDPRAQAHVAHIVAGQ